jgi:hypothetical protein
MPKTDLQLSPADGQGNKDFAPRISLKVETSNADFFRGVIRPILDNPTVTGYFLDSLTLILDGDERKNKLAMQFKGENGEEKQTVGSFEKFSINVPTTLFPCVDGVCCLLGEKPEFIPLAGRVEDLPDFLKRLKQSNQDWKVTPPPLVADLIEKANNTLKASAKAPAEILYPRVIRIPNHGHDRDLNRAFALWPNWDLNENTCKRYLDGREETTVSYQPPEILRAFQEAPEMALRALDDRFNKLKNELTADLIEILFHNWRMNKLESQGGRAGITLRRICEYRGVSSKPASIELHWRAMLDARAIRLTGGGIDDALFDMASVNLFGTDEVPDKDMAYLYQPGFLLQHGLKQNEIYYTPFLESIWNLDPYREPEAKRLARFLRGEWRLNSKDYLGEQTLTGRQWHTWGHMLTESGIFPDQWPKAHAARKMEGIKKAVETLYQREFVAECGDEIYHPEDRRLLKKLPIKGRLAAWLELRVCLRPAADIEGALREILAKKRVNQERNALALAKEKAKTKLRKAKAAH